MGTASVSILDRAGDVRPLAEIEIEIVASVLVICAGNMTEVAKRLGLGRSTVYRKVHRGTLIATRGRARRRL